MKVRVKETELEVLVGTVLDSNICNSHSRCCGRLEKEVLQGPQRCL